ncbi:hypothetical protein IB257_24995 [Achromobacter sp. ACM03]|nr:hypothetical protein [Achromobacter sp. ACM03]
MRCREVVQQIAAVAAVQRRGTDLLNAHPRLRRCAAWGGPGRQPLRNLE